MQPLGNVYPIKAHGLAGLTGSLTALVTPMHGGQVDEDALAFLCDRQVQRGTAALVICGSTGEAASLLPSEQARVIRIAAETAAWPRPGDRRLRRPGDGRGNRPGRSRRAGRRRRPAVRPAPLCQADPGRDRGACAGGGARVLPAGDPL